MEHSAAYGAGYTVGTLLGYLVLYGGILAFGYFLGDRLARKRGVLFVRWPLAAASALVLLLLAGQCAKPAQAAGADAAPASVQHAALDPQKAVYELRIYYPAPGKRAALNARFREHTLALFEKHGMRNVAYWNEEPTEQAPEGRVIYVLAYPSRAARDADWKAFGEDPEWRAVVAASEAGGKLVTKVDSMFMTMTDYSPPLALPRVRATTRNHE